MKAWKQKTWQHETTGLEGNVSYLTLIYLITNGTTPVKRFILETLYMIRNMILQFFVLPLTGRTMSLQLVNSIIANGAFMFLNT